MALCKRLLSKSRITKLISNSSRFVVSPSMEELMEARRRSDEELIIQVDENNNEIGFVTRQEMRERKLMFRASYILVFNANQQLYVQKRVMTKDYCAGYFDVCAGGVVGKNESNDDNAYRELQEEFGIDLLANGQSLKYHGCFRYKRVWENIYSCQWDGEIIPQLTEMESVHLKSIEEIKQEYNDGGKYCPDSICALNHYLVSTDLHNTRIQ